MHHKREIGSHSSTMHYSKCVVTGMMCMGRCGQLMFSPMELEGGMVACLSSVLPALLSTSIHLGNGEELMSHFTTCT